MNHVSFDTAKKLRDVGFPQEPTIVTGGIDGEVLGGFYYVGKKDADAGILYVLGAEEYAELCTRGPEFFVIKLPTLSELMDGFIQAGLFFQMNYWPSKELWFAEHPRAQGKGENQEEAVADLLLVLRPWG